MKSFNNKKNELHAPYEHHMYPPLGLSQTALEWVQARDEFIGGELRIVICREKCPNSEMWLKKAVICVPSSNNPADFQYIANNPVKILISIIVYVFNKYP